MKTHTAVLWTSLWAGATTTTSFSTSPKRRRQWWTSGDSPPPPPPKETVVDFRRAPPPPPPPLAHLKKGNQRLYFMKKLKSFSVCPRLLELFYRSTAESVVTFNSLCHFGSLKEQDKARLSKITKTATRLTRRPVPHLQAHFEAKAVKHLEAIYRDPTHPLCACRAAGPHFDKTWKTDQLSGQDKPVPLVFSYSCCPPWQHLK